MRRLEPWRCPAGTLAVLGLTFGLLSSATASAEEDKRARAIPSLGVAVGLSMPYKHSDLELEPALTTGFKLQVGDRHHSGLAPYFFLLSSQHRIRSLTPNLAELGGSSDDPRIDPDVRLALLNRKVRLTLYGVGIGYLIIDDAWIQPYIDLGVGGGAIGFSGSALTKKRYGGGAVALHAAMGADIFIYAGFAVGVDLRTAHMFTDNPFDRDAPSRGMSVVSFTVNLKYWDR